MCYFFAFVYKSERTVISKFVIEVNMIKKFPVIQVAPYNQVFRRNFQFVNLIQLCLKVKGASYNQVRLRTEKTVTVLLYPKFE